MLRTADIDTPSEELEASAVTLQSTAAELSIVVPTFNEQGNIHELYRRLEKCLGQIAWEVIFVDDDSLDRTVVAARELAQMDNRVRILHRIGRRGLSSACIEGMLASAAPFVAVMDGDLQHEETLLPRMLQALKSGDLDVVVGSRYVEGGSSAGLKGQRSAYSRLATRLSRLVIPPDLKDPMSGFFMLRRSVIDAVVHDLSGLGFKILLDIFASAPERLRFRELPYEFRDRLAGDSKLDNHALWDYGMLLLDKLVGRFVPVRFLSFIIVGGIGVFVHMLTLALALNLAGASFLWAQSIATLVAMTGNFALNNVITYRDMRLRGWGWLRGWFSFALACSVGAVANVGVAQYLFSQDAIWFLAGLAGVLVGAVWNFVITRAYTWNGKAVLD